MTLVRGRRALPEPLGGEHGLYVIAQYAGPGDFVARLAEALESLAFEPAVAVGESTAERERLWAYREMLNESIREEGVAHKLDVAVPIARLPAFAAATTAAAGDARLFLYGHLGDGNVHVNLLGPGPDDEKIDERILRCATDLGGTISAEHGSG
jgi:FAD/FMN-containing dehydrogenase